MNSIELAGSVVVASLAGSFHCVGMCGPFAAIAVGEKPTGASLGAYHGGRLAAYSLLGALAGTVGAAVDLAGSASGLKEISALVAGGFLIAWGVAMLVGSAPSHASGDGNAVVRWTRKIQRAAFGIGTRRGSAERAAWIGISSALLPCGWLYMFLVMAAGAGGALAGATVMGAFALGTVPWLVGLNAVFAVAAPKARALLPRVSAVAMVALGLGMLIHRVELPSFHAAQAATAAAVAAGRADEDEANLPPCCRKNKAAAEGTTP